MHINTEMSGQGTSGRNRSCQNTVEEVTESCQFVTLICRSIDVCTHMCVYVVNCVKSMLSDT